MIKREERCLCDLELINPFYPINMTYHLNLNTLIYLTWAVIKFNTRHKNKMKGKPNILQNDVRRIYN